MFTDAELSLVNQSLGRIGAGDISAAENGLATCNKWVEADRHYVQTRDSLLRSTEWNFAITQAELVPVYNIRLGSQPITDWWVIGDIITGLTSYTSAIVTAVISGTEYEVAYAQNAFTFGERITNADVEIVYADGDEVTYNGEIVLSYDGGSEVSCSITYPVLTALKALFSHGNQFELPLDFERLTRKWRYSHSFTIQGHRLLAHGVLAKIEYVRQVTDPEEFDSLFTEVLILTLALKLLSPLAGNQTTTFRQDLKQDLNDAMRRARTVCAAEDNDSGRSEWLLARYGSGKVFPLDPTHIH